MSSVEFTCTVSPASDWRFWLRVVLVRQLITLLCALMSVMLSIPTLPVVLFAISWLSFGQRITVDANGLIARWLFVTKFVPIDAILKTSYSRPQGLLNAQVLLVELAGKPTLEFRGSATNLRAIGHTLAQYGHAPIGAVHRRANRGTTSLRVVGVVVALLALLSGFAMHHIQ